MCWTLIDDVRLLMQGYLGERWRDVTAIVEEGVSRDDTRVIRFFGPEAEHEVRDVLKFLELRGEVVSSLSESGIVRLWRRTNVVEKLAALD